MDHLCLSENEIRALTSYKRPSAQLRELRKQNIEAQLRSNNTVLVYRRHLPVQATAPVKTKHSTLNLEALIAHVS